MAALALCLLICVGGSVAFPRVDDQLAVADSVQEVVASPLAQLLATAAGSSGGGPVAILPLAPNHFRSKRKPQRFRPRNQRNRFQPTDPTEEEEEEAATEGPGTTSLPAGDQPLRRKQFSSLLGRRPRPAGLRFGATSAPAVIPAAAVLPLAVEPVRQPAPVALEPLVTPIEQVATTEATPFQLEDFFGTPEPTLIQESSGERFEAKPTLHLPVAFSNDISEDSIVDEVRARTIAITGAQPVGVSRDFSSRKGSSRQLLLPQPQQQQQQQQQQLPQLVAAPVQSSRQQVAAPAQQNSRQQSPLAEEEQQQQQPGRRISGRKGGRRPSPAKQQQDLLQENVVQADLPRKPAGRRQGGGGGGRPSVGTVDRYKIVNDDGSITWGYENEDGSYKEETIGVDCITQGKYGYIDPTGEVREYAYTSGVRCDPLTRQVESAEQSVQSGTRGPNGQGYFDYAQNKFVMADGRRVTVVVNQRNRARGQRY